MGEWKEIELDKVAKLSKRQWKVGDDPLPYIGLEHIAEGRLRLIGLGTSDEVASQKYHFDENSFLFGKLRPYFRKLYRPAFHGICSTDIWVVKACEDIDLDFLFYFFSNKEFIDVSYSGSSGTRMPRADWGFVSSKKWLFPEQREQRAIASVLSSLDAKIDLLHRQNKTLEAMAETLFRQWFVVRNAADEAEEGWEQRPLSSIANYLNGVACQKYPAKDAVNRLPVLKIKELGSGISDSSDWATSEIDSKYHVVAGDVVFSWSATLMVKLWDGPKAVLNQHLFKVTSEEFPKWFYFMWTKHYVDEFVAIADSHATTFGHIKRGDLDEAMVLVPGPERLQEMTLVMDPLFAKHVTNSAQIKSLTALRDTLLPKLMSGEVRVEK
jgi:type I restriction enzyme S subunit